MAKPWFTVYEKADQQGARMHVCQYAYCTCLDCHTDPVLRRRTAIDRSEPQAPKVGGVL